MEELRWMPKGEKSDIENLFDYLNLLNTLHHLPVRFTNAEKKFLKILFI